MIDKEIADDRREQLDHDFIIMENSGKNLVKNPFDGLHVEKNNNLGMIKAIFLNHIKKKLLWSIKG